MISFLFCIIGLLVFLLPLPTGAPGLNPIWLNLLSLAFAVPRGGPRHHRQRPAPLLRVSDAAALPGPQAVLPPRRGPVHKSILPTEQIVREFLNVMGQVTSRGDTPSWHPPLLLPTLASFGGFGVCIVFGSCLGYCCAVYFVVFFAKQ